MIIDQAVEENLSLVRVDLPVRLVSIAVGRSIIRRVVTFVDEDAESSFLVAFTEIMANAIEEHERVGSSDPVRVEVSFGVQDVVRVIDQGGGMRRGVQDIESIDENIVAERGRGLVLARAFVAALDIDTGPTGTTATLPLIGLGIVR